VGGIEGNGGRNEEGYRSIKGDRIRKEGRFLILFYVVTFVIYCCPS
jgi:hypothetical protein